MSYLNQFKDSEFSLILFGDSIAEGCGAESENDKWTYLLCQSIEKRYDCKVKLTNLAVGGTSSLFGYHKLKTLPENIKADAVFICYGQNDAEAEFAFYYEMLLRNIFVRFPGVPVYCILESSQREYTAKTETIISFSEYYGCQIIDTIKAFAQSGHPYEKLTSDGVHVNNQGQKLYFDIAFKVLENYYGNNAPDKSLPPKIPGTDNFGEYKIVLPEEMKWEDGSAYCTFPKCKIVGFDCTEAPEGGNYEIFLNGVSVRKASFKHEFSFSWERIYRLKHGDPSTAELKICFEDLNDKKFIRGFFAAGQ